MIGRLFDKHEITLPINMQNMFFYSKLLIQLYWITYYVGSLIGGSKERKVPALVMRYLPIIDHLKHMFSNARQAQLFLWHVQQKSDGKIRHPTDGRQWKQFDHSHEDFSNDPRNIRFGLSTDGMNPFREMRNPHST
jgi:hypothetical protein